MFDWMSESLTDLLTDIKIILNSFYFWLNDNKEILVSSTILLCNKTAKITIIYSLIPQK